MATSLQHAEMKQAMAILNAILNQEQVEFVYMGGSAVICTLLYYQVPTTRTTSDLDIVIKPNDRFPDAARLSNHLITHYPDHIGFNLKYGVQIPFVKLSSITADVEIFDAATWPTRPQYNFDLANNGRSSLALSGISTPVPAFDANWLLREKILTLVQRGSTPAATRDRADIAALLTLFTPERKVVLMPGTHDEYIAALRTIYNDNPNLRETLIAKIDCQSAFWTWSAEYSRYYRYNGANEVVWAP